MKRVHIFYIAVVGILLFFGLLTGRREFFLCFFVAFFLAPVALLLNIWTYVRLKYKQELSIQKAPKEAEATLDITVANDKPFGFKEVKLHVRLMPTQEDKVLNVEINPRFSASFTLDLACKYRGIYRVGISKIEVTDIFGFFHIVYNQDKRNHYALLRQKVYPRLLTLKTSKNIDDMRLKTAVSNEITEFGDSFAAMREYRIGDPIKKIHWPTAAKKNELFVKIYDAPIESAALIVIDTSNGDFEGEDRLKYADIACESALAIAKATSVMGYATTVSDIDATKYYTWKSKRQSMNTLVEKLTELPFSGEYKSSESLAYLIKTEKNIDNVYFITHRNPAHFEQNLLNSLPGEAKLSLISVSAEESKSNQNASVRFNYTNIVFGEDILTKLGGAL